MTRCKPWLIAIASGILSFVPVCACRAQGFVEHCEPPVLERGKTTRVTVVGSQFGKPIGLWTSLASGAVKATPVGEQSATKAVLDIAVANDAPVGIFGVRLATENGLGNACVLLIDDLPVKPAKADAKTTLPVAFWGRFREATVDRFAIDVTAGQRVSFEAVANRLGKDVDPLVTIRDARGKIVAEHDNDAGLYFDCRFAHTFATAGSYTVEMRDARFHGSEHGFYVLRMGKFPAARVAVPIAIEWSKRFKFQLPGIQPLIPDRSPTEQETRYAYEFPADAAGLFFGVVKRNGDDGSAWLPMEAVDAAVIVHQAPGNTIDDGTPARIPGVLCGVLQKPDERHFFRVELTKGQRIQVRAEARAFNSPAELEIAITDAKGKEIRRAGENAQEEVTLDFNAGTPGIYGLTVRDVNREGGPAFAYRLDVRTPQPFVQVTADIDALTVPHGDYQPIPLTLARSDYAGKITLSLVGAPPGVTLSPSEIEEGVNSVVCKLTAAQDAPMGIHTLQILAQVAVANASGSGNLVRTRPLIDKQIINVDLIPHALREDQRRLPPALTDRFALQITPPSFFTFELPQPLAILGRYQHVEFPIALTRTKGFEAPIVYTAKGGQLAAKEEGRTRVYAEFAKDKGSIHSKILTNLSKHRVDVTAIGVQGGRQMALTRTFDLDVRSAFTVSAEPAILKLEPGETSKVRLNTERLKSFDGDVTVQLSPVLGLVLPAAVVIPRGQTGVDVEIKVPADRTPGRQSINLNIAAVVNGFEEELRGRFEIEIVQTPAPKK
ncbi:MAG: hypothetical protein EXR98_14670 [Gemmataceae bacterium]|nr:hypothetical protein [Gemmataceae bacterium]